MSYLFEPLWSDFDGRVVAVLADAGEDDVRSGIRVYKAGEVVAEAYIAEILDAEVVESEELFWKLLKRLWDERIHPVLVEATGYDPEDIPVADAVFV